MASSVSDADVLALLPDFVVVARYDSEQGILVICRVNRAAERILQRQESELVGAPLRSLMADGALFASRAQRDAFFEDLRSRGELEFPGLTELRDAEGRRRYMRIRLHWPPGGDTVVAVGEDLTDKNTQALHAGAVERLRSAMQVSGLLSHHINNALSVAMMNVEAVGRSQAVRLAAQEVGTDIEEALLSIQTASDVLAALAATNRVSPEVEESCDVARVLREVLAVAGRELGIRAGDEPCFVWGSAHQVKVILEGFVPLVAEAAPDATIAAIDIRRGDRDVIVGLQLGAARHSGLQMLIDPALPQAPHRSGGRSVRLFASAQVLHALGGQLSLPTSGAGGHRIELTFSAAPGEVKPATRGAPVLLVSPDAALRALLTTLAAPRAVRFTEDVREALAWSMEARGRVVICDVDRLTVSAQELAFLHGTLRGPGGRGLILARRDGTLDTEIDLPQMPIPVSPEDLRRILDEAGGE